MRQPSKRSTRSIVIGLVMALGFLFLGAASCDNEEQGGAEKKAQAFDQQSKAVPYPSEKLTDSTERRNLRERLLRTNDPNRQGFVYLMNYGQIVGYYAIKGKVSSTQSAMLPTDKVVDRYEGDVVVQAPGDDGSYGDNEPGIFFFTTDGVMVSTSLDYIESDAPLPIDVPRLGGSK